MIILGIETSCDETAVSILRDRAILANIVSSSMRLHKKYGGVVPEIATRFHTEVINYCLRGAIKNARINLEDIDLISVTQGPGLMGALLVGISVAKALAYSLDIPIVGINHVIAHLWANALIAQALKPPFIGLVVSGGHTSLFLVRAVDNYSLLGQTQDDAAGEAFDKVAKLLGLGYPGGPAIEKAAKSARHTLTGSPKFSIPSSLGDSLDFSFSGIKTAVLYYVKNKWGTTAISRAGRCAIASAFQEAVCDALARKAILACKTKGIKTLVVGGGVSANARLREKLVSQTAGSGIRLFIPPLTLCVDNAAMTALLGGLLYKKGHKADLFLSAFTNFNA